MKVDHLHHKIEIGVAAGRLLDDEAFKLALKTLTEDLTREWSNEDEPPAREILWYTQKALRKLAQTLRGQRDAGKVAETALLADESGESQVRP